MACRFVLSRTGVLCAISAALIFTSISLCAQQLPTPSKPVIEYIAPVGDAYYGGDLAVDHAGNAYYLSPGANTTTPTTYLTKLDPTGKVAEFKLTIPGDAVHVAAAPDGTIYVAGGALAATAVTSGAFQAQAKGKNAFIAKLKPDGTGFSFASYLGGSGEEQVKAMTTTFDGRIVVAGTTTSHDFPVTANAAQAALAGSQNAFVAVISPDGKLLYSTYWGGSGADFVKAVTSDSVGNIYVGGETNSFDFPTTAGVVQTQVKGGSDYTWVDIFVTKFGTDGHVIYSTALGGVDGEYDGYWGTDGGDRLYAMTVDDSGQVILFGQTAATDFPNFQGQTGAFVAKLSPAADRLLYVRPQPLAYDPYTYRPGSTPSVTKDSQGNLWIAQRGPSEVPAIKECIFYRGGSLQPCGNTWVFRLDPNDGTASSTMVLGGLETFGSPIQVASGSDDSLYALYIGRSVTTPGSYQETANQSVAVAKLHTQAAPALKVAVTPGQSAISDKDQAKFRVTVSNIGNKTLNNVKVNALPTQNLQSLSAPSNCSLGNQISCSLSSLAPGAQSDIDIAGTVAQNAVYGTGVDALAQWNDGTRNLAVTGKGATPQSTPSGLVMTLAPRTNDPPNFSSLVRIGDQQDYLLTIKNGLTTSWGATIVINVTNSSAPIVGELDFVKAQASQGSCSGTNPLTCSFGPIPAGGEVSAVLTYKAVKAGWLFFDLQSKESACLSPNCGFSPLRGYLSVFVYRSKAHLSVAKLSGPSNPIPAGSKPTFTYSVRNAGPEPVDDVLFVHSYADDSNSTWTTSKGSCVGSPEPRSCAIGHLEVGERVIITGTITSLHDPLQADVIVYSHPNFESDYSDIAIYETYDVLPKAIVLAQFDSAPSTARTGDRLNYIISVKNYGDQPSRPTALRDLIRGQFCVTGATSTQGQCKAGGFLDCNLGMLAGGATARVNLTLLPTAPGKPSHFLGIYDAAAGGRPFFSYRTDADTIVTAGSSASCPAQFNPPGGGSGGPEPGPPPPPAPPQFSLSALPDSATIASGGVAEFTVLLNFAQGSSRADVNLSCSGLPAGGHCAFSPETISASGPYTAKMLVSVPAQLASTSAPGLRFAFTGMLTFGFAGLIFMGRSRKARWLCGTVLLAACAITMPGCGGTRVEHNLPPSQPTTTNSQPSTSASYTVLVTGTVGDVQQSTKVTVNVR